MNDQMMKQSDSTDPGDAWKFALQTPSAIIEAVTGAAPHWIDLFTDKSNPLGAHRHFYDDGKGGAFREDSWIVPGYVSFANPPYDTKTLREFGKRWAREALVWPYALMVALLPLNSSQAILDVVSVTHHVCVLGRLKFVDPRTGEPSAHTGRFEAALYIRNIPISDSLVSLARVIYVTREFAIEAAEEAKVKISRGSRWKR